MSSIFTKIINRDIPAYIISENDLFIAFLDVFPLGIGHILIVSKIEVDKMYNLPQESLMNLMTFAQPICNALEKTFLCKRIGMAVIGLEIPHAHLHLVPLYDNANDLNFTKPKLKLSHEELFELQQKILSNLPKN
jgi:histidine triad (HIT) family protein